jgi:hypothetical protein
MFSEYKMTQMMALAIVFGCSHVTAHNNRNLLSGTSKNRLSMESMESEKSNVMNLLQQGWRCSFIDDQKKITMSTTNGKVTQTFTFTMTNDEWDGFKLEMVKELLQKLDYSDTDGKFKKKFDYGGEQGNNKTLVDDFLQKFQATELSKLLSHLEHKDQLKQMGEEFGIDYNLPEYDCEKIESQIELIEKDLFRLLEHEYSQQGDMDNQKKILELLGSFHTLAVRIFVALKKYTWDELTEKEQKLFVSDEMFWKGNQEEMNKQNGANSFMDTRSKGYGTPDGYLYETLTIEKWFEFTNC